MKELLVKLNRFMIYWTCTIKRQVPILHGAVCPLTPQTVLSCIPDPQQASTPPFPSSQFKAPHKSPQVDAQHLVGFLGWTIPLYPMHWSGNPTIKNDIIIFEKNMI